MAFPAGEDVGGFSCCINRDRRRKEIVEDEHGGVAQAIEELQTTGIRELKHRQPVAQVIEAPVCDCVVLSVSSVDESLSEVGFADAGLAEVDDVRGGRDPRAGGQTVDDIAGQSPTGQIPDVFDTGCGVRGV